MPASLPPGGSNVTATARCSFKGEGQDPRKDPPKVLRTHWLRLSGMGPGLTEDDMMIRPRASLSVRRGSLEPGTRDRGAYGS